MAEELNFGYLYTRAFSVCTRCNAICFKNPWLHFEDLSLLLLDELTIVVYSVFVLFKISMTYRHIMITYIRVIRMLCYFLLIWINTKIWNTFGCKKGSTILWISSRQIRIDTISIKLSNSLNLGIWRMLKKAKKCIGYPTKGTRGKGGLQNRM